MATSKSKRKFIYNFYFYIEVVSRRSRLISKLTSFLIYKPTSNSCKPTTKLIYRIMYKIMYKNVSFDCKFRLCRGGIVVRT